MSNFPNREMLECLANRYPTMDLEAQATFMEVIMVIRRLSGGMDSYFQTLGVSQAGFKVMMNLLYAKGNAGVSPATLSENLCVTRATVTGVLDTLENSRWIERKPDPNDRRALLIQLTEEGQKKLDEILPIHYGRIAKSMSVLTTEEQRTLRVLMQKFSQGLDALESSAEE